MAKINQRLFKGENNSYLEWRNAANNGDVSVIKLNASDAIEFATTPKVGANDILTAADKGVANGVAPLDGSGKILSSYLEALAITDVSVAADITARDALTVQEGDVAVVTDASADPNVTSGSASYIYDGAAWQRLGLPDEARLNEIDANANDLITLSGVAENATTLGTFTGTTIADNQTIKVALQSLETAVEAATGTSQGRQVLTLDGTDITNGYKDLAEEAIPASVQVSFFGVVQEPTADFTQSVVSSVTRITFAGDLAAEAIATDKLVVYYEY